MGSKNRTQTEQDLMDAVGRVIRNEGFPALGINRIAAEASVSKVLIYRYFESLEGLIKSWLLTNNFWFDSYPQIESKTNSIPSGPDARLDIQSLMAELFHGQIRLLRPGTEVREMLRWFLCTENPVTREVMDNVEERGSAISRSFISAMESRGIGPNPENDSEALIALLVGGLYYLALVSDRVTLFNGIDLSSDQGWERIEVAIKAISTTFFLKDQLKEQGDEDAE